MTNNRAAKRAARARMKSTREPYSVAIKEATTKGFDPARYLYRGFNDGENRIESPEYREMFRKMGGHAGSSDILLTSFANSGLKVTDKTLLDRVREVAFGIGSKLYWPQTSYLFAWFFREVDSYTAAWSTSQTEREVVQDMLANVKSMPKIKLERLPLALRTFWSELGADDQTRILRGLADEFESIADVSELDGRNFAYWTYTAHPPVKAVPMENGDMVKLRGSGKLFKVQAQSERYVVLTADQIYTIIDWERGVRGAHNSYGYSVKNRADAERVLTALETRAIEVSYRNKVRIEVERVRKPKR